MMAKYLVQASYTDRGLEGLMKDGGTARQKAAEQAVQSVGGKLEAFYFSFGESDVYSVVDVPDNVTATALALASNAGGGAHVRTTVLLTPAEVDQAIKKNVSYRPPGR
jgi:uncharacterized protein with GYD domain